MVVCAALNNSLSVSTFFHKSIASVSCLVFEAVVITGIVIMALEINVPGVCARYFLNSLQSDDNWLISYKQRSDT